MSRFVTADKIESVTAHEVINSNMTDGTSIIVIMENVICTSGLQLDGKNKDKSVISVKFECTADFNAGQFDTLPIHIFYPDKTEQQPQVPDNETDTM